MSGVLCQVVLLGSTALCHVGGAEAVTQTVDQNSLHPRWLPSNHLLIVLESTFELKRRCSWTLRKCTNTFTVKNKKGTHGAELQPTLAGMSFESHTAGTNPTSASADASPVYLVPFVSPVKQNCSQQRSYVSLLDTHSWQAAPDVAQGLNPRCHPPGQSHAPPPDARWGPPPRGGVDVARRKPALG